MSEGIAMVFVIIFGMLLTGTIGFWGTIIGVFLLLAMMKE